MNLSDTVNDVKEGDPLEIFTDRDGEVIFKKYSPIGELTAFAAQYAETLHKTCDMSVIICDRDSVVACAGVSKKEYGDKPLSEELEAVAEGRSLYLYREGDEKIYPLRDSGSHYVSSAMPIISEGDIVGVVASLSPADSDKAPTPEELAETGFALGKINTTEDLISYIEDKHLEQLCDFIKQEEQREQN